MDPSTQDSSDIQYSPGASNFVLTILHHPDGRRVGERASVAELVGGLPVAISRTQPDFRATSHGTCRSLEHPRLSRTPVWLRISGGSLSLTPARADMRVTVDDQLIGGGCRVELDRIRQRGIFVALGGCVLLWLSEAVPGQVALSDYGIHGISQPMRTLFDTVQRVAQLSGPVLIGGESGVGKELIARTVHRLSPRSRQPWFKVDMATVPPAMVANELFGHGPRRLSGSSHEQIGGFARAHRGALFINEIGETPLALQPQILRALEDGEIRPVGMQPRKVDVRLLASTELDLTTLAAAGKFRRSLLHRLQQSALHVPPLRERPVDIPMLLHLFLRARLREFGATSRLSEEPRSDRREWLRLGLVTRLMRHAFPGNVHELRSIAAQIALHHHDKPHAALPKTVADKL